jgi:acetate kinase
MRVLVVNAGSSSLKLALLAPAEDGSGERGSHDEGTGEHGAGEDVVLHEHELAVPEGGLDQGALRRALHDGLGEADAVGHRIVHGGERFREAVEIDDSVEAQLRSLAELAPLHQARSLAALDAVSRELAGLPAVACFDTAFHATLPPAAATYALPAAWRERWGLRRYGFHGLSHAWVARRAPRLLALDPAELRIVSCHLGAGASLCAIHGGRSIDTTMGFTPLEGLVMATRSGSIDPGLLLWLAEDGRVPVAELADGLEHRSGLLGLAGSADMREISARADGGEARAQLALEVYARALRAGIAAMSAALGGLDALVFTGGVGEHSAEVRALAARGLGFLGVALDEARNRDAVPDVELSAAGASVRTLALRAREDAEIARQTRALLD